MGKKEVFQRYNSLWSISSVRYFSSLLSSRYSNVKARLSFWSLEKGFTLIELIVVVGIISIISFAAMTILNPTEQFMKANDGRKKADLSQIQKALEQYYEDHGGYPESENYKIKDTEVVEWGDPWQPYMNLVPTSPNGTYVYDSSDTNTYRLYAHLEREKDADLCNVDGSACPNAPVAGCGDGSCNYGVSSPNVNP